MPQEFDPPVAATRSAQPAASPAADSVADPAATPAPASAQPVPAPAQLTPAQIARRAAIQAQNQAARAAGLNVGAPGPAQPTPAQVARRAAMQAQQKAAQSVGVDDEDPIAKPTKADVEAVKPVAPPAFIRDRHRMLVLSFVVIVLLPVLISAAYLWGKAADQYASTVGFSVRREDVGSAMELLGGLTGMSKSSSSDTDILYEFLKSQKLVADMQAKLNLREIWSKPQGDPIYAFDPDGSIEDLVDYWTRMVQTSYDGNSGLIEIRVLAFTPQDATHIAQALFDQSSEMINDLSAIAREDAIRYARAELETAQDRLKLAREAMNSFRTKHQMVDPSTDIQTQAGLLGSLQSQLAEAQIELDLLGESTQADDPRLRQAKRRIEVIETRIAAERSKVGISSSGDFGQDYAALVGDYERLAVDSEFAEKAYLAALASFDAAQAEARRKSRYLAAHILPTTAEVSRYPARLTTLGVIAMFIFLAWSIGALVAFSLRDRR